MNNIPSKKMQFVITTCYLFGTAFSASFFGVDFSAPNKVVNTGLGKISHVVPSMRQSNSPLGGNLFFSNSNTNDEEHGCSLYPTPGRIIEEYKFRTHEPPKVNTPKKDNDRISDPSDGQNVPLLNPEENNQNTGVSELVSDDSTLGWSETGTDYTTETSEYETTTDEPLNRIGGAPPAVVASLLG